MVPTITTDAIRRNDQPHCRGGAAGREGEALMVPSRNTETVSEKKRRGRPPAFDAGFDAAMRAVWGDRITTKHSVRNKAYLTCAMRVARPEGKLNERYRWFAGDRPSS